MQQHGREQSFVTRPKITNPCSIDYVLLLRIATENYKVEEWNGQKVDKNGQKVYRNWKKGDKKGEVEVDLK